MKLAALAVSVLLSPGCRLFAQNAVAYGGYPALSSASGYGEPARAGILPVSIYGEDDRRELFETDKFMRKLAGSTVALFRVSDLAYDKAQKSYKIGGATLKEEFNLDDSQRFGAQPSAAFCSGALVGEDTVLTGGHCLRPVPGGVACDKVRIAFGYAVTEEGRNPAELPGREVYFCKQVLLQENSENGPDYALIRLDRKVKGHYPLAISRKDVEKGEELAVIGHPNGLPVKIAKNGRVRRVEAGKGFFVADLDTFHGNSGSPVFNMRTMKIEGILVRGGTDYLYAAGDGFVADPRTPGVFPPGRADVVGQDEGRGEDVTLISRVEQHIAPTWLEKALDALQKQKEAAARTRTVPAVHFPGSGLPALQPAVYYREHFPAPAGPVRI